jgi:hypothetical protein
VLAVTVIPTSSRTRESEGIPALSTEAAIFADLAALERNFREAIMSPRFGVAVPGGAWVGERANVGGSSVLAVRTYYDADSGARVVTAP